MKKALLLLVIISFCCTSSFGQNEESVTLVKRFANWRERSMMRGCDTAYIQLPENAWIIKLNGISTFSEFNIQLNDVLNFEHAKMKIGSGMGFKSSFSLAYRGLELGYSIDQTNRYNRDIKLNLYNKRFGGEFQYQSFRRTSSTIETTNPDSTFNFKNDYTNRMTINFYYVFNYKTFSYPAAITQAFIQKKSAGSFLLGASFFRNKIKLFQDGSGQASFHDPIITLNQASIGGGYGYNFVCCESRLLFHISAMPMLLFSINENISSELSEIHIVSKRRIPITANVISRAAICYTYQDRLILSLNAIYNLTRSTSNIEIDLTSNGWIIQCCIGWRMF